MLGDVRVPAGIAVFSIVCLKARFWSRHLEVHLVKDHPGRGIVEYHKSRV